MKSSHSILVFTLLVGCITSSCSAKNGSSQSNKKTLSALSETKTKKFEAKLGYFHCGDSCTDGSADWGGGISVGIGYSVLNPKNKVEQSTRFTYVPNMSFSATDTSLGLPILLKGDMSRYELTYNFLYHGKASDGAFGAYYGFGAGVASNKKDATVTAAGVSISDSASETKYLLPLLGGFRWANGMNAELGLNILGGFSWNLAIGYSF